MPAAELKLGPQHFQRKRNVSVASPGRGRKPLTAIQTLLSSGARPGGRRCEPARIRALPDFRRTAFFRRTAYFRRTAFSETAERADDKTESPGGLAQLGERSTGSAEVRGSSPLSSTR